MKQVTGKAIPAPVKRTSLDDYEPGYLATTAEVAPILGLTVRTLEQYRASNQGPPFVLIGERIRYRIADLRQWTVDRTVIPKHHISHSDCRAIVGRRHRSGQVVPTATADPERLGLLGDR